MYFNKRYFIFIAICLLTLIVCPIYVNADEKLEETANKFFNQLVSANSQSEFQKMMDRFMPPAVDKKIAEKFEDYIKDNTGYSDQVNRSALMLLLVKYCKGINEYSEKIEEERIIKKRYSPDWIKDLRGIFAESYIRDNMDQIRTITRYLWLKNDRAFIVEFQKGIVFYEFQYVDALKNYLGYVLRFIDSLSPEEKKQMEKYKNTAKLLLETFSQYPMQVILSGPGERLAVSKVLLEKEVNSDSDLYAFFLNHPTFQKPFNPIQVLDDLDAELAG